jgi:fermentation-respiration switch protein FrsA (DUF1100 family)
MQARLVSVRLIALIVTASCAGYLVSDACAQNRETLSIRGRNQSLRVYGTRGGTPVVVSSGDGGWIHLAPHVAELLASRGFFVVGFDVRGYLESFTAGKTTLRAEDEPSDYKVVADFASHGGSAKPILIGVSEGAGLSVLAATDPHLKAAIAGVIGLGLPDLNELGWRWRDMSIYLTHGTPDEPSFSVASIVDRVAPVPLGAIHSAKDEFVPVAEVQLVMEHAKEPKRLWIIKAADHRFSDNLAEFDQCLLEATTWIIRHSAQ